MPDNADLRELAKSLMARLELDGGLGVSYMPRIGWNAGKTEAPSRNPSAGLASPRARVEQPAYRDRQSGPAGARFDVYSIVPPVESAPSPAKEKALAGLRAEAMECRKCRLCAERRHVVWGEGALDADMMFIGEGPGRDEDEMGRPFVGRAGRVLSDIIEKGIRRPRGSVYIANVVKCRPPGNREPQPDEAAACRVYLDAQIGVISPKVIITLGRVAGNLLAGGSGSMGDLRGRWFSYAGIPLRATYHPSYLLRQRPYPDARSDADKKTWEDMKTVLAKLGAT